MLVLSRNKGQIIEINFGGVVCKMHLLELNGRRARLGFEAPPAVKISRPESAARHAAKIDRKEPEAAPAT